jgi:hypothetical protein
VFLNLFQAVQGLPFGLIVRVKLNISLLKDDFMLYNIAVIRIQEVLDSNLGPITDYPDCGFSQALQTNSGIVPEN